MSLRRFLKRHQGEPVAESLQQQADAVMPSDADNRLALQQLIFQRTHDAMDLQGRGMIDDDTALEKLVRTIVRDTLKAEKQDTRDSELIRSLEHAVVADLTGYGPLQPLMEDADISDILVNGPHEVWIDRNGVLEVTGQRFIDEPHLMRILDRMVAAHGRHLEEATPYADIRLEDGSRLHAIIPPLSSRGPVLSIRKKRATAFKLENLITAGSLSQEMADYLIEAVRNRKNILVSGGAGAGKTTLLSVIGSFIPPAERVCTIEETLELELDHPHVIPLESRPASTEGRGEIDLRTLLRNALRMRSDRIIVGEVRGSEVFDMLQAMNIGHPGSMTTLHANSPQDAIRRLETLLLLSGVDLPEHSLRSLIGLSFDVVVQLNRDPTGFRQVDAIVEIEVAGDEWKLTPRFEQKSSGGKA